MTLWIILTLMVALAVVGVSIPLVRRYEARVDQRAATLAVLKDQLAEIDGQEKAGTVVAVEAEALRTELRRRLLAESRETHAEARPLAAQSLGRFAFGMAAIVALAATGLYAMMGRPDLTGEPVAAAGGPAATEGGEDVDGLIRGLEQRMEANPSDPEGWRMLGWSYFQRGRFGESANAYRRAVALAPTAPGFQSAFGEALVQASQGNVTPEAAAAFEAAQKLDPSDARARYFLAVAKDQRGDRAGAITDWVNLLNEAPADAPWAPDLRQFVERIAKEDGIDLSGRLKPAAAPAAPAPMASMPVAGATGAMPQPSQEQVRDAMALPEADRQAMVRGMVDGLAARLQASPRDSDGWVRLMRARMVLGERDSASAALKSGLAAFSDTPAEQQKLRDAAAALGVPGA